MRILVLQLCRLGDILQTTPMLRGLRRAHPDAHITVVTHDRFAHVPVPPALYDRWIPFPVDELGGALRSATSGWRTHVKRLRAVVDDLAPEPFDLTLNLTHSDLAGLLAALLPSSEVRGGLVAHDRTRVVQGPWMTYFWSSQTCRDLGCFNLVDIHNWTAGVPSVGDGLEIAVPDEARRAMTTWLDARGLASQPFIAVQLGASDDRKRWPPERFAEAVSLIPAEHGSIVLVGAEAERPLADRFAASVTRPFHDSVGATTIPELATLLERARVLLTNDTGTMHVAAASRTRIVDVSTGPVFVHETGPYGEGHHVIEPAIDCFPCAAGSDCHHIGCRERIVPADVAALVMHTLGAAPMPRPDRARILRGRFLASGRLAYQTVWPHAASSDVLRESLASVWEETMAPGAGVGRASHLPYPAYRTTNADGLDAALVRLALDAEHIAGLAARIPTVPSGEQCRLSDDIAARLDDMQRRAKLAPEVKPFVAYLKVRLDSIVECDVAGVSSIYIEECVATAWRARALAMSLGRDRGTVMRRSA